MIALAGDKVFHTIQGEGKFIGYPTSFVRMSRCNLRCTWKNSDGTLTKCDTPYTSFEPEIDEHTIDDIVNEIDRNGFHHVVVSGGEPFFQKKVVELLSELRLKGHYITVETNGTLYHDNEAQFLSISPKLKGSSAHPVYGERHERNRLNYDVLEKMITKHDYQFKFVINDDADVREILDIKRILFERTQIDINEHIWLMPQGITGEQFDEKLEWLAEVCKNYNWKLTDRFHIRIWGSRRGV